MVFFCEKMLLLRTIILKLIFTIYSASALDVIELQVKDGTAMSASHKFWLTENQPFKFFIESDVKLDEKIWLSYYYGREITTRHLKLIPNPASTNSGMVYILRQNIIAKTTMNGTWKCMVYTNKKTLELDINVDVDVDECNTRLGPCSPNANCKNTRGSYECTCFPGFKGNGTYCQDLNECQQKPKPCDNSTEICTNTVGGYYCAVCPTGFKSNGYECEDIDECLHNMCHHSMVCFNTIGSFECRCATGYYNWDPWHSSCTDIDECRTSTHVCPPHSICENTLGSFECKCELGYRKNDTGKCEDIDECQLSISYCNKGESCWNTEGEYTCCRSGTILDKYGDCQCPEGLILNAKKGCVYNQCLNNSCGRGAECRMRNAKAYCYCSDGSIVNPYVACASINIQIYVKNMIKLVHNTTVDALFLDEKFTISVDVTKVEFSKQQKWITCHKEGVKTDVHVNQPLENGPGSKYIAKVPKATKSMSGDWACRVQGWTWENNPRIAIFFPVTINKQTVETAPVKTGFVKYGEILVNDVIVNTTQEVKAKGTYEVVKGEIIKVSCKKNEAPLMSMSYFDGKNYFGPKKSDSNIQTMYLKIGNKFKGHHVLCNVQKKILNNRDVQSIRLDFKKRKTNDLPKFNINGLTLAPTLSGENEYTIFYEFFEGEFINFTVSNWNKWKSSDGLEKAQPTSIYSDFGKNKTKAFSLYKDDKTINTIFNLRPIENDIGVIISGLPFHQTNIKYLYNRTTYRTMFFNKNNEMLNLSCSSMDLNSNCSWVQNSAIALTNDSVETYIKNATFSPQDSESTDLKCMCVTEDKRKYHEVTILRDPKIYSEEQGNGENDISDNKYTALDNYEENLDQNEGDDDEGSIWKLVVIIVVAVVIVTAVIWLTVGLYKRRQRREKALQSEFNYQSLDNTTERQMPPPAQWDNYSLPVDRQTQNDTNNYSVPYIERNVEDMYAKPQPKTLRKPPSESTYAEPSYATVDQKGDKATYGNLSRQATEYSQIQPKKLIGNPNTPKVLPTETYAEVLPKSMRPNKESSKYINVFDNQRYVNSATGEVSQDRSEYAEPAYCEVGFKK